jgi:hypothetical protein
MGNFTQYSKCSNRGQENKNALKSGHTAQVEAVEAHPCCWQGSEAEDIARKGLQQEKKKAGGGNPGLQKNSIVFPCCCKKNGSTRCRCTVRVSCKIFHFFFSSGIL